MSPTRALSDVTNFFDWSHRRVVGSNLSVSFSKKPVSHEKAKSKWDENTRKLLENKIFMVQAHTSSISIGCFRGYSNLQWQVVSSDVAETRF